MTSKFRSSSSSSVAEPEAHLQTSFFLENELIFVETPRAEYIPSHTEHISMLESVRCDSAKYLCCE